MKTIKKVAITKLPVINGKIVDSLNAEVDETTNAPSINAIKQEFENRPNVLKGIDIPSNTIGNNGDIYIQYFD